MTANWPMPRGLADRAEPPPASRSVRLLEEFQPFRGQCTRRFMKPVALPPGRARLATKPEPTGSAAIANTIGIVRVACKAAGIRAAAGSQRYLGRERDQFRRISLEDDQACLRPSDSRYAHFGRRSNPESCRPSKKAAARAIATASSAARFMRTPIAPHASRLLRPRRERPRRRAAEQRDELAPLSFDHLVGNGEQPWRKAEAECPGGVEVDHELEFGRLHDR